MTPRRVLITGAAGFVGRHMMKQCRAAWPAARLHAATRRDDLPVDGLPDADAIVPFDLFDPDAISAAIATTTPDLCIHLAARADVAQSFEAPDLAWTANVDGTRTLASAILRYVPAALLLHAGSAEVYGLSFQNNTPLDESAPLRPANPYAASKAAIDLALGEMALRGLQVVRMRPLNHVGPGQSPHYAVASFARQIARIEAGRQDPVIRTGALDRERDFLDVRDVCAAYIAAVDRAESLPNGAVFNIASGTPRKLADVLAALLDLSNIVAKVDSTSVPARPLDIMITQCSAAAARAALDWMPVIQWAETLADILAFWRGREEGRSVLF
ncbi:MAG TPA: NAD-dependent epimerase/dehydratase family protein [Acetobacteraceae bacterium]|nr:NAD-dependent epimerase/dehydratase family protein [Acetobacteraceae bacterium]